MAAHRKRIRAHPGEFAEILGPILGGEVFTDRSTRYKRPKEGSPAGEENWYQMKNCYVAADIPVGPALFDRNLADRLVEGFEQLTPLYYYWRKLEASAS